MNSDSSTKNKIAMLIEESKNIAIIPSDLAGLDAFCAGAALFYMIREKDKNVSFIYPGKMPQESQGVISSEHITTDIDKRSLLVSIDYSGTEASKVKYSTEDDVLYLRISPISRDYNKDQRIRSRVVGFDFDTVFVIGAQRIYDLGNAFKNLDTISKVSRIVNIDNTSRNEKFGFVNVVDNTVNSTSHLVFQKSRSWDLPLTERAAKALLKGIVSKEAPHIS